MSPDGRMLGYVRGEAEGARIVIRRLGIAAFESERGVAENELTSPWSVRSARSLGGGCFEWMPDSSRIVAVSAEGDLKIWHFDGTDDLVLVRSEGRIISSPNPDRDGSHIAYVLDQAEIHDIEVVTRFDRRVDTGEFEFVVDPVWRGGDLVWHAWSPPHMPWDESALVSEGGVLRGGSKVQHQQPQTSLEGDRIGWLDDGSGWLNVVIDGCRRIEETFEHGGPTWGERQRSWCFDADGTSVALARNEGGFGRLCSVDLSTGLVVERAKAVHGQLSWRGNHLAAVRTGGKTPTQIVVYDTSADEWQRTTIEVGPTHTWSESTALVEPELLRIQAQGSDQGDLHARLYRSGRPSGRLMCWIHGGPTDQWQVAFMPRVTYWVDRGYDVLVPDFRGSTGHGRAYTQALSGGWGVVDVDDVERILSHVMDVHAYPVGATALLGSSAGGFTALLLAARRPDLVAAVVTSFPVSDISALDAGTHRFEAHYNRSLIGTVEETARLSAERSPVAQARNLARVPLLVFHGDVDPVVPLEQSRRLAEAVRSHGGRVDMIVFEGEGHGFRSLENKIEEFERTENFLEEHLRT